MTPDERRQLQRIIAEAAAPDERAACAGFSPIPERDTVIAERRARWQANISPASAQGFERILAARGLNEADVSARLTDVEVAADGCPLPWAQALGGFLEACAGTTVGTPPLSPVAELRWPLLRALAPIDRCSETWLRTTLRGLGLRATPKARRQMLDTQLLRLHRAAFQCLSVSADDGAPALLAVAFPLGGSILQGWLQVFTRYPALACLLAEITLQWRTTVAELLRRLAADRDVIEQRFNSARPLGALSGYSAGGDVHEGGRSVTILTFSSGRKLVYKPKDVRIAAAFIDLVRALNARGLPLDLHTRAIVANRDYAWEEFVAATPCTDREQLGRFYVRCGMLLRLLQALRGSDFHYENILAAGEHPVAIDLEMLLQPELAGRAESPLQVAARQEQISSPLSVGMLPWKAFGDPGHRAADFGVLLTGAAQQTPYKTLMPLQNQQGQLRTGWYYPTLNTWPCLPTFRGRPVGVTDYVPQLLAGYHAMAACLQEHAAWLCAPEGPIAAMGELPVRIVLRSSNIYARLLEESYAPEQLVGGIERDFRLERLWRAYAAAPQTAGAIAAEVDSLRTGVIPTFTTLPSGADLTSGNGMPISGIICRRALPEVLKRLRAPDYASVERDVDIISSALATALPPPRRWQRRLAEPPAGNWLDHAAAIGDFLLAQALPTRDGSLGWFGLTYTPWAGASRFNLLDDSLLGAGGFAVVLAELARLSGAARFHTAARSLLVGIADRLANVTLPVAPAWVYCGSFYGPLAGVYPLLRSAHVLAEPALAASVYAALRDLDWNGLLDRSPVDLVSGRAGLLLALHHLRDPESQAWPARLGQSLQSARLPDGSYPQPPYPPGERALDGLPGTERGVALALARWDPSSTAGDVLAAPATAGDVLACLALTRRGEQEAALSTASDRLRHLRVTAPSAALLDGIELALAAAELSGDDRFRRRAARLAQELLDRHAGGGRWFPDSLAADRYNLSALNGVAAVALAFLRLHDPTVPPIRLLA